MTRENLYISEIYHSLQGEGRYSGRPCTFIRLTGCDLRCSWCDSEFSFKGGRVMPVDDVVEEAKTYGASIVEVTGGEPLAQKRVGALLESLTWNFDHVLLETAGHRPLRGVVPRGVWVIMDVKLPASGEHGKTFVDNYIWLRRPPTPQGELKFVIQDEKDFEWALNHIGQFDLDDGSFPLLFSPVFGTLVPGQLADWLLESDLENAKLQFQMHKLLWTGKADYGMEGIQHVRKVDFECGHYHVPTPEEVGK